MWMATRVGLIYIAMVWIVGDVAVSDLDIKTL